MRMNGINWLIICLNANLFCRVVKCRDWISIRCELAKKKHDFAIGVRTGNEYREIERGSWRKRQRKREKERQTARWSMKEKRFHERIQSAWEIHVIGHHLAGVWYAASMSTSNSNDAIESSEFSVDSKQLLLNGLKMAFYKTILKHCGVSWI